MAQASFIVEPFAGLKSTSKPKDKRKEVGNIGEGFAVKYLVDNGYRILRCNWKCKCGEIDIVAVDGDYLVFVEVKTRRNSNFAKERLLDTITRRKLNKLRSLARIYIRFKYCSKPMPRHRVDVLGIILDPTNLSPVYFRLIKGISFD
jgi:putative endonuclease